jgi:hypothetical protein
MLVSSISFVGSMYESAHETDHPLSEDVDLSTGSQTVVVPDVEDRNSYVIARESLQTLPVGF